MKRTRWTFDKWFREQFGAMPMSQKESAALLNKALSLRDALRECDDRLDANALLHREYRAARLAWEIRDEAKGGGK